MFGKKSAESKLNLLLTSAKREGEVFITGL